MKKYEYNISEIIDYLEKKFEDNQALKCTIDKETKRTITIRFRPLDHMDIRNWFRPLKKTTVPEIVEKEKREIKAVVYA